MTNLTWKKFHPLTDQNAFICLVDSMGDDSSIVQAARVSYGKDEREPVCHCGDLIKDHHQGGSCLSPKEQVDNPANKNCEKCGGFGEVENPITYKFTKCECVTSISKKDRSLIRYLMNHSHTTPFEMVEIKFMVQVPMDCWRQWIRHRTASVNEYSTRYTEALDFFQVTNPSEWRLQATNNKQGSSGYLETGPDEPESEYEPNGRFLSGAEHVFHQQAQALYKNRLEAGVAKEQARKDLPLSTYTRAYWKCDLHNIFNFLRLRMDSHAQLEIRQFANCMFEIVKELCPVACEAFEDYVLHAKKFSRMEMELLRNLYAEGLSNHRSVIDDKPDSLSDREWKEFLEKLQ